MNAEPHGPGSGPDEVRAAPGPGAVSEQREVVVVGASAGGVEALTQLIAGLPLELPAAVFVVLHLAPHGSSLLPSILDRSGPMPVTAATDGERFERGHVYVCPPDMHMLVVDGQIRLTRGPRENGHRPAIDPLFRSAGRSYGRRAIGVVLSGTLDDGAAGLRFLKGRGGAAVVQDPADALYPGMPEAAVRHVDVDRIAPADRLADVICALLDEPLAAHVNGNPGTDPVGDPRGPDLVELGPAGSFLDAPSETTALTCPECGGVLSLFEDGHLMRFGCHVGHTYSAESLAEGQAEALENALWAAIRALEERADLLRRMGRRSTFPATASRLEARARDVEREARSIHAAAVRVGRAAPAAEAVGDGHE
jgi:two-component system, chemotaxis family, protein-glutamate methylesterase/glutaminase